MVLLFFFYYVFIISYVQRIVKENLLFLDNFSTITIHLFYFLGKTQKRGGNSSAFPIELVILHQNRFFR